MPRVKIAKQMMDDGGGLGFFPPGHAMEIMDDKLQAIREWTKGQMSPIVKRVTSIEKEISALQVALKKTEKRLNSQDMKSQNIIDKIEYHALDVLKKNDLLKSMMQDTSKKLSDLEKVVSVNKSGILNVTSKLDVKEKELRAFTLDKVSVVEKKLKQSVEKCLVKNMELTVEVSDLTKEVKRWPGIHNAFSAEYGAFVKRQEDRNENFTNDIEGANKSVGVAVNRLNALSADFSNHVGDMVSQVASFKKNDADFNSYRNSHKQVHSKQDADFANEKLRLNKSQADFKEHTKDYGLHKIPKSMQKKRVKERQALLSTSRYLTHDMTSYGKVTKGEKKSLKEMLTKMFSILKPKGGSVSGLGAIARWWGGNQHVADQKRTWRGGNQHINSSTGGFSSRYLRRG